MSRGSHTFKERDLARAIKVAQAAGYDVDEINFVAGTFKTRPKNSNPTDSSRSSNEWDRV